MKGSALSTGLKRRIRLLACCIHCERIHELAKVQEAGSLPCSAGPGCFAPGKVVHSIQSFEGYRGDTENSATQASTFGQLEATYHVLVSPHSDLDTVAEIMLTADMLCRFPFLLLDRVLELESQKHAIGYKNITANDNFFTGHFPDRKIMPGTDHSIWLQASGSGDLRDSCYTNVTQHSQSKSCHFGLQRMQLEFPFSE